MKSPRPIPILILAWLWIVAGAFGAAFNIYGVAAAVPPYSPELWLALLVAKIGTVAAGVLLLRMQKVAARVYAATAVFGWLVALAFTNSLTPLSGWRYAVGVAVLAIYAAIIWRYWDKLQPQHAAAGVSHA